MRPVKAIPTHTSTYYCPYLGMHLHVLCNKPNILYQNAQFILQYALGRLYTLTASVARIQNNNYMQSLDPGLSRATLS